MQKLREIVLIKERLLNWAQRVQGTGITGPDKEYLALLDWFYELFQDNMALQQYDAARREPAYFMRLIVLAEAWAEEKSEG